MFSYILRRSCLASLALAFLVVRDVRVNGSHVSPVLFSIHIPGWIESSQRECRKSHSHSLISNNFCSRISLKTLSEWVQLALYLKNVIISNILLTYRSRVTRTRWQLRSNRLSTTFQFGCTNIWRGELFIITGWGFTMWRSCGGH